MKKLFLILLVLTELLYAQDTFQLEKYTSRYRLTGDNILMKEEPNIGVVGIGVDVFGLIKSKPSVYLGVNSYSALSGERSGIFSFGIAGGQKIAIDKNSSWSLDYGMFVGGGGGGNAADGGGLIIRPHLEIEKTINKTLSLRAGVAHVNFVTGAIKSTNANFGLSLNSDVFLANQTKEKDSIVNISNFLTRNLRFSLVGTSYQTFMGNLVNSHHNPTYIEGNPVRLIGASFEKLISNHTFVLVELNGAVKGGVDGYMSYFLGLGRDVYLYKDKLYLEGRLLAGPSGGGGVSLGGGASFQAEAGLGVKISDHYDIKLLGGKTIGPWGTMNVNHFDIHLSKKFETFGGTQQNLSSQNIQLPNFKLDPLNINVFNRVYFPPKAKGKFGVPYDSFFNLLGFEIEKELNKHLSVLGATIWAYQGSYGAYGEGWIGSKLKQSFYNINAVNVKLIVGAAGGGGLDMGSGLLFQYGLGYEKELNKNFTFLANVGQVKPLEGNFTPIFVDMGVKLNISQLVKSN